MPPNFFLKLLFLILIFQSKSFSNSLQISVLGGFGSGTSKDESQFVDEPIGTSFRLDYFLSKKLSTGMEHIRVWGNFPVNSSISFTNWTGQYIFLGENPSFSRKYSTSDSKNFYSSRALSGYLGASLGFGQSTIIAGGESPNSNNSGLGFGLKLGLDYNLWNRWGIKAEGNLTTKVVGRGSLSALLMVVGLFYLF